MPPSTRPALVLVLATLAACGSDHAPPPPPPPPASAAPASEATATAPAPSTTPTAPPTTAVAPPPSSGTMVPVTTAPPSASTVEAAQDLAVCTAALHCCEAASREARMAARMEGYDLRRDPRDDPRYDPRYDPRRDPRYDEVRRDPRARRVQRLASGCRSLRSPDEAHAHQCAEQIEQVRRAFREVGAAVPSSCHMPDLSSLPTTPPATGMPTQ